LTAAQYKKLENQFAQSLNLRMRRIWVALLNAFVFALKKGRQRFTVMAIPHSENRIFNFQISFFSLIFFGCTIGIIVAGFAFLAARFTPMNDRLAKAFEAICKRFVVKINDAVDALLKFSSDLFEIPFESIKTDVLWLTKSRFYYKFKEQPGGIEIVASSMTVALPKFIGDKIILKKMQDYLVRVVDMQLGRSGNDFEERIQKSKLDFRWEMRQRIEATIEGIGAAVEKGMAQRSKSEEEIQKKTRELAEALQKLDGMKDRLINIKNYAQETKEA